LPDAQQRFAELGAEPGTVTGAEFGRFLTEDSAKWTEIIKASGATAD
jgi:tripartite-type tricarboxylate transporter receptor subunit TctC